MATMNPTEEAYAELQHAYNYYNEDLFEGRLPGCMITLQRQKRTFGYYSKDRFGTRDGRKTDEIAMNPEYFAVVSMVEVLQTLVHEMAHLWQARFGEPSRACYHNIQWANKMEAIGLMPSHNGQPGGKKVGQSMADYVIVGGRFDRGTKRLITSGFAISWLDRFPAARPRPAYVPAQLPAPPDVDTDGDDGGEEEVSASGYAMVASNEQDDDPAIAAASKPPSESNPDLVANQKTGNRSNRCKYSCPACALNVWGKPGLRVICGECEKPLAATDG